MDVTTLVLIAVFILPGYVAGRIARRGRAHERPEGSLQLVLDTLLFSGTVHFFLIPWSARLAREVPDAGRWHEHVWEGAAYLFVVGAVAPLVVGWTLAALIRRADDPREPRFPRVVMKPVRLALGAVRDIDRYPPRAWDTLARVLYDGGGWVVAKPKDGPLLVGKYGEASRISVSPSDSHDIFLEELWWPDRFGNPVSPVEPRRGVWLSSADVEYIQCIKEAVDEQKR
jgi:Family of unknown function (DUF6338)